MNEAAIALLEGAAEELDIVLGVVEITHETGECRDLRMGQNHQLSRWHLRIELFGDNGFNARRHQYIVESAEKLEQCINRAIVGMRPKKKAKPPGGV
jgi:hypothetical protein